MISERLRGNYMPMRGGLGAWHIDPLTLEAAEVIDALVAALERAANEGQKGQLSLHALMACGDALAMARKP